MQLEPLTTLNPSRVPGATPLPSRTASFGPWPETAPLRMVFPSCHLQNPPTVIDARLSQTLRRLRD